MKRSGGRMANPRFGEAASDDGSDDDPGHGNFEVASEEVLKARNLHRRAARRRRADAAPAPATRNPFAAVALTKTGSPGSGASAPAPAPVANPFAGRVSKPSFASGAGSAAASSVAAASPAEPSENVASAPSRVELSNGAAGSSSRAQPAGGEATRAYYAQVRSLNESFATWVRQQATANPLALWTDGVNDYARFASELGPPPQSGPSTPLAPTSSTTATAPRGASAAVAGVTNPHAPQIGSGTPLSNTVSTDEACRFEARAKLYRMRPETDEEGNPTGKHEWADAGVGTLRVLQRGASRRGRITFTNEAKRTLLNAALFAQMNPERKQKSNVAFVCSSAEGKLTKCFVKVKTAELADQLKACLDAVRPE